MLVLTAKAARLDEAAIGFLHCILRAEDIYYAPPARADLGITTDVAVAAIAGVAVAR